MPRTACYLVILLLFLFAACSGDKTYVPQDLRKLSKEEITERLKSGNIPNPQEIVFRLPDGIVISYDSILNMPDQEAYTADVYVDEAGVIIEQVLRKMTAAEKEESNREIKEFKERRKQEALEEVRTLPMVEVDCNDLINILDEVYRTDQDTRLNGGIDDEVDRQNLKTVISIIKKCGMPTIASTSEKSMSAIWLVLQHSPHEFRKAYFPLLKEAAARGDFKASQMALMEDRLLMGEGEPQIYGSQLRGSGPNGEFELWELKEPEYVDQRRAEVGLGPLSDYLSRWGVEFNVPQKQK
ncbi:MAG: hypothetical protein Roseis2KO_11840 [Roseivirga sp.]